MPLTRWKIISPGVCRLLSYSHGFLELTRHQPESLRSCFTCVQLYPSDEFSKTQYFFDLICSGKVDSFTARVPLLRPTGEIVDVFSMIKVEYEDGVPSSVCCCMKQFDQGSSLYQDSAYFLPFLVKVRKQALDVRPFYDSGPIQFDQMSLPSPNPLQRSGSNAGNVGSQGKTTHNLPSNPITQRRQIHSHHAPKMYARLDQVSRSNVTGIPSNRYSPANVNHVSLFNEQINQVNEPHLSFAQVPNTEAVKLQEARSTNNSKTAIGVFTDQDFELSSSFFSFPAHVPTNEEFTKGKPLLQFS